MPLLVYCYLFNYNLDVTTTSNPSWLETIQQKVRSVLQVVNLFQSPVNQSGRSQKLLVLLSFDFGNKVIKSNYIYMFTSSDAARVRKEYDESSTKLSKIQSRISSLTQKLKHDFGQ